MKIKFEATINNMSLKKDGEYRIEFKVPLLGISRAISMVRLLGTSFKVGIISTEKSKAVIEGASFFRLIIDREGESKIMLSFNFAGISNDSLAFFGQHQEETVMVIIKGGENESKD